MADRDIADRTRAISRLCSALSGTLALALGLPAGALGASEPGVPAPGFLAGSVGDRAAALWRLPPQDGGYVFYFAEVYQGVNTTEQGGRAVVGVGNCFHTSHEEICQAIGFGHELAPREFEVKPLLDVAVLDYRDSRGARQEVRWEAVGDPPSPKPGYRATPRGGAAEAKASRQAKVSADLNIPFIEDGHVQLRPDVQEQGVMARGSTLGAGVPLSASGYETTTYIDHDGRYHIKLRRPL